MTVAALEAAMITAAGVGSVPGVDRTTLRKGPIEADWKKSIQPVVTSVLAYSMTYHRATRVDDGEGGMTVTEADTAFKGLLLTEDRMAAGRLAPEKVNVILIAQDQLTVTPALLDRITARGVKWRFVNIGQDPAHAMWRITVKRK